MKKISPFLLFIFLYFCSFCQKQNNHWYFGHQIALDFTSGSPVFESGSQMLSLQSSSVISDSYGNLLFYTNGGVDTLSGLIFPGCIWNRNHQIMSNGILGDTLTTHFWFQTTLIVPKPHSENIYYLFSQDNYFNKNKGLRYTIVDMSLDNGFGRVTDKGVFLMDSIVDGISAYPSFDNSSYWLCTVHLKPNYSREFYVYNFNSSGIYLSHIIPVYNDYSDGMILKFSPDGKYLYCGNHLYKFDNQTGIISNFFDLTWHYNNAEFSSDSKILYATYMSSNAFNLVQFDLSASNILASKYTLDTLIIHGDIKLANNGKIYYINLSNRTLSCINNPNNIGSSCNLTTNVVNLNGLDTYFSFPNTLVVYDTASISNNISVNDQINQIAISPNPFNTDISINIPSSLSNDASLNIFDQFGRLLLCQQIQENNIKLNLSFLNKGIYFIKITNDKINEIRKIIKYE